MNLTPELQAEVDAWKNQDAYNDLLHARFTERVNTNEPLKAHRDWVEANQHGFGDRPFGWAWKLLIDQMPDNFTFLEVGVFKGQITSLVSMLGWITEKHYKVYGVTTLEPTPDDRCKYPDGNYRGWISRIHAQFKVPDPELIVGNSEDARVVSEVSQRTYDIVYLDGGHNYITVVHDIQNYAQLVKPGGFLVADDASINRLNVGSCWSGLEDVSRAVKDHLDYDKRFRFLFCVGHLNIYQRVQ